ncbi:hypothetical protein F8568_001510 [Actinomadura sp. LD22]|uniref:Uncharacterized protein n=1 Tax=Actinomadura physcomitrii TaxID=2650748 RepID=A0A6I4MAD8_9ACTN|nr:hypothetical protein [Actinomadura physcomitrii]MVZ99085.1 hypothetical protein [Actinomadura physcomitrii]
MRTSLESWTGRDGRVWWKGGKTKGKVVKLTLPAPFRLGGPGVGFEQLQKLPAKPDALKAWITASLKSSNVRTSAGRPDAAQDESVFDGLLSLVAQLSAPQKVRAAAFRALASYPNVKNIGAVKGGLGLSIAFGGGKKAANLVVDPKTSRITDTDFFVSADGAEVTVPGGATIAAEWTNLPPK